MYIGAKKLKNLQTRAHILTCSRRYNHRSGTKHVKARL